MPLQNKAKSAKLLASGEKLSVTSADGKLVIKVPATAPDAADSVIALQIEGEPVTPPLDAKSAWLEIELEKPTTIGAFGLDEPDVWPRMSHKFTLEAFVGGEWKKIADGKTNGHGMRKNSTPVTAQKFRLTMECDKGSPGVAELQLYPMD